MKISAETCEIGAEESPEDVKKASPRGEKRPENERKKPPKHHKGQKKSAKWQDSFYVKAHLLAKDGFSDADIAAALGVSAKTFYTWIEDNQALRDAVTTGRGGGQGPDGAALTFQDYVYDRLSPEAREVWETLMIVENERDEGPRDQLRLGQILFSKGSACAKRVFLHAIVAECFNPTEAMRRCGISRRSVTRWCNEDADFKELVKELDWHKANFFEGALVKLVKAGDPAAVIFANKTYNRKRGYGDRLEIVSTQTVTHKVRLEDTDLTLEQKKELLESIRRAKPAPQLSYKGQVVDAEVVQQENPPAKRRRG